MDPQNPPTSDPKSAIDQAALVSFVDDLMKEKKDSDVKADDMPRVREFLLQEVNNAINTHMVSLLSEQDQVELDKVLDSNPSDEQLNTFFEQKIPNLEIELAAALLNFRAAYLYPAPQEEQPAAPVSPSDAKPPAAPLPAPIAPKNEEEE